MNIVSFYCPRPEHPYFQDYRPFLDLLRLSCARLGHNHLVLTDDAAACGGSDAYHVDVPRSLMRAVIAAQHAYLSDPAMADVPTLLVGADCVLARDPAVFAEQDCDLAITVGDFADCRMNTGAIYVPRPGMVAEIWEMALDRMGDAWGDDQTALYSAIKNRPCHGYWTARVCELPVDPYNLAPDNPSDDCTRGVVLHFRGPRKAWMAAYCRHWLGIGDGVTVTAAPNSDIARVVENVRINVARGWAEVGNREAHEGSAVLVGGGPSLSDTLGEIQRRASEGQTIFALNGTASWLELHGVEVDYQVILDPRPENARFLDGCSAQPLLASQCDPLVLDRAAGRLPLIWHFGEQSIAPLLPPEATMTGGGITVGVTAMALAFQMGFRKLHLYGYDSSDIDGASHAYVQDEDGAERKRVEVWCAGRKFIAGIAMYAQAEAFPRWAKMLTDAGVLITVHGDGLLPTVARQMQHAILIEGMAA